jgi:hypothetical protein
VLEAQGPPEQGLGKQDAARQREGQEHEPGKDDAKQHALHREQRRQRRQGRGKGAAMQPPLEQRHQQRVQRGDGEQAVGRHAEHQMQPEFERVCRGPARQTGKQQRQGRAQRREPEHERLHSLEAEEQALDPVQKHGEPEHHRERLPEAEAQLRRAQQRVVDQPRVDQQRRENRRALPSFDRGRLRPAPARPPEMQRERGVQNRRGGIE